MPRIEVNSEKVSSSKETFTIDIKDGEAKLMWDTVVIPFTISKQFVVLNPNIRIEVQH
ncbi:MAG: hypothetical protein ACI9A7_000644 [Cyclobacteriaceae bacterium]